MKTRTWIILFAVILALCLSASFYLLAPKDAAAQARITRQGQVIKTVDLSVDQTFTVESENGGYNVITVQDGKIAVTEASCPDHYCMMRGFCDSGTEIVCLPNKLSIGFLGEQEVDALVG